MRNRKALRLISMLLTLAMLLSSSAAMADIITVKNSVSAYAEPDGQNVALQIGAGTYDVSRYNNEYYQFTMSMGGAIFPLYIKISDVASDSGDGSGSGSGATVPDGNTTSDALLPGENDPTYEKEILNYTVPAAGLFLYASMTNTTPSTSIAAGEKVKLTYEAGTTVEDTWYSTWYNNMPYYVRKADLAMDTSAVAVGKTYALRLKSNVQLYSSISASSDDPTGYVGNEYAKAGTLSSGMQVNVTVYQTKQLTVADEVGNNSTKTYATWFYFEPVSGTKQYFKNPEFDEIVKDLDGYNNIVTTSGVAYYATQKDAEKAMGKSFDASLVNIVNPSGGKFEVYSGTDLTKATKFECQVVYDLRAYTGYGLMGTSTSNVEFYACEYYDNNGRRATGYIEASKLSYGGTVAVKEGSFVIRSSASKVNDNNIVDKASTKIRNLVQVDADFYVCQYLSSADGKSWRTGYVLIKDADAVTSITQMSGFNPGGFLADTTGQNTAYGMMSNTLVYMYGQFDSGKSEKAYNRITNAIAIDQKDVPQIKLKDAGFYQSVYRDANNNRSEDKKTAFEHVYFKPVVTGVDEAKLQSAISVFTGISAASDLEKFPTGFCGTASAWQGLFDAKELTNRCNYKTQTKTVDGVTYYRVTWYRVQFMNKNGTMTTGYYENPAVYNNTPTDAADVNTKNGYYKLTSDTNAVGGDAFDTINGSGADTKLLKKLVSIDGKTDVQLYTAKNKVGYYYTVSADTVLYGVRSDDTWYEVIYSGKTYYVLADKVKVTGAVAVSDTTLASSSFYVTIGADGAQLYTSPGDTGSYYGSASRYLAYDDTGKLKILPAGKTVLVSKSSTGWYKYFEEATGKVYYIQSTSVSNVAASGTGSSWRAELNNATVYGSPNTSGATARKLTGIYSVQEFNTEFFAIRLEGTRRYIKRTEAKTGTMLPITTTGKSYSAVVGESGAKLFKTLDDAKTYNTNGAGSPVQTLQPGAKITVTQIDSYLFLMTTKTGNLYIALRDISAIVGNDDDGYNGKDTPSSGVTADDVISGKTDANYTNTVLKYTVPAGGLWLYSAQSASSAQFSVAAGVTLNLSAVNDQKAGEESWYATWYNGKQYFVRVNDLQSNATIQQNGSYTIQLKNGVATYYKLTTTTSSTDDPYGTGLCGEAKYSAGNISAGTYNVTVYKTTAFTAYNAATGSFEQVTLPTWYSFVNATGTTVYFQNPNLGNLGYDRRGNDSDHAPFNSKIVSEQTKLYYGISQIGAAKANGVYSKGTTSQTYVYGGMSVNDYTSGYALFQYDNYDTTATNGWQYGRTTNDKNHRGSDYNNAAWDRKVSYERVTDIKPYMYAVTTDAQGAKSYAVTWYSGTLYYNYNHSTKTYDGRRTVYFNTTDGSPVGDLNGGAILNATVTSGSDVNFTLSIPVLTVAKGGLEPTKLYAERNNADTVISTTAQGAEEITYLPGIEYNSNWYKVAYNGEGWFVQKTDVKNIFDKFGKTVIACATNGALSTSTLTVTIGTSGARLYSKPETNSQPVYENTSGWLGGGASNRIRYAAYEQNRVGFLSAGTIVSASRYNDSWYTHGRNDGGVQTTYYFRAADVANSIDASTVDSYILTIPEGIHADQRITLYSSMSTADSNPLGTNEKLNPGTYNVRKMADVTWSRVLYKGLNYYFKTADAEKIFSFVAGSDGGVGLKVGETYVALKINETEASTYVGATDGSDGTRKGGKEVKFKIKDVAQGSGYTFTVSGDGITYYSDPAATVPEKTLPAGTYEAKAVSASVYSIILGGKTYYVRKADIEAKKISFTTKACLDIYNAARQVVYGADEYDASGNALGLPVGTYETGKSVNGYEVVSSDGTWIELSKSGATYYIKASDITRYTQLSVSGPSHKLNVSGSYYYGSGSITAESDVNFYNPSAVSTSAATQTKYLSQRLGALASAIPIANSTTDPIVKADALNWKGVYNKVVKINDNWAAVTIPEADPINGTTPNVKYDSTSKTYTITTGATRYAGNTYYVYIGGKTVDPAGSINSVNATENGGVTSAIGGAIATVNDGKTYTITIGANGAKVYNNAKLESSSSTEVIQTIPAGTKLSGTKLTAAYLVGTEYRFQSVYKITYNGYTAYISAGDVAGVEKGDDEQEREDEKNNTKPTPDTGDDSEPLDINVGDPELTVVLATTIVAYGCREANVASAINIPAGTTVGVTKVDENWYQLRLTNGNICYIPVKDLTMEDVASTERITDGTGYITKLLTVNVSSGSSLNMRKTASTGGTILAYLQNGTYLTNMGYTKDANGAIWYRVSYNGITGYVHGNYVAPVLSGSSDKNSADSLRENVGLALTVNTDNVYIRTGAGPENPTIDRLAKGSIVVPTEAVQGSDGLTWYKITYNGTNAYIRYDYVSGGTSNGGSLSGNAAIRLNSTNLRSGAGMSFQVVARLKKNAVVTILSTSTDSEGTIWYRITSADKSGYVRGDMLRSLTNDESADLINGVIGSYKVLKVGSRGSEVTALQQALINKGFLGQGEADGIYGSKTMAAVKAFQTANSLTANGIADATTQAKLYGKGNAGDMKGNVFSLDWFADGYTLINAFPHISVYDCNTGVTWNAKYINGKNHADVIPASATDAQLLTAYSITGSYVRRPCIITINGTKYAGSMYAVGHGTTNYCSWFSGVMCIHFTGSKTHTSGRVDADHQKAIQSVLTNFN